jgi:WD40 repeat protein
VATAKQLRHICTPAQPVLTLTLAPDGKTMASGGEDDPHVSLWEMATGRLRRSWHAHDEKVEALAFSPDGKVMASGGGGVCSYGAAL